MIDVQSVLGPLPLEQFVAEYLHRRPAALAGCAAAAAAMGDWKSVGTMLAGGEADVLLVRGDGRYEGDVPTQVEAVRALCDQGYTLRIRHAERRHPGLAELARAFATTFRAAVDIQVFATPPGQPGFSWHYDAEDVFIIQTSGAKEYSLRKNTVNPWPLEENLPADMQYERELMPLMEARLCGGDLLYIPCGWWHKAQAAPGAETAISLAVGVMSPSGMDLYDFLRPRLRQSLVWRQRLPMAGAADAGEAGTGDAIAGITEAARQLAEDFAKSIGDPRVAREFLESRRGDDAS